MFASTVTLLKPFLFRFQYGDGETRYNYDARFHDNDFILIKLPSSHRPVRKVV